MVDSSYEIDSNLLDEVEKSIQKEEKNVQFTDEQHLPDIEVECPMLRNSYYDSHNEIVSFKSEAERERASELYREKVLELRPKINNFSKELTRMFMADNEECMKHTSGSYNIIRGSMGTSVKVFDKKKMPDNISDVEICILVDQSGSMSGKKIEVARDTAIVLSEALQKSSIKHSVIGFTADAGAAAVHKHYVSWDNKKEQRVALITMEAMKNNFDSYSIRYAGELLRKRQAENKILFVISDGEPDAYAYRSIAEGIADTTLAIKEVSRFATVFGIAIGVGVNPEIHQKMYGKNFVYCEDPKMLTNLAAKKLKKIIAK